MRDWLEARAGTRVFFSEVRRLQEIWDVLEHPFVQRWRRSRLGLDELRCYAAEYELALVALASAAETVASVAPSHCRDELRAYALEKTVQLRLWRHVLDELGVEPSAEPAGETKRRQSAWSWVAQVDVVPGLTVLFTLESAQAATATVLLDDLARHDGASIPALAAYLQRDAQQARRRADSLRRLLGPIVKLDRHEPALDAAEAALSARWDLLNAVDRPQERTGDEDGVVLGTLLDAAAE